MWVLFAVGSIAALSIYAGMPIARSRRLSAHAKAGLTAATVGVLLYLFTDVVGAARDTVAGALQVDLVQGVLLGVLVVSGFTVGALILPSAIEAWVRRSPRRLTSFGGDQRAGSHPSPPGVSAMGVSTVTAVAIGVHNFSEGLVVGAAYAGGLVALTYLLAIGVIAHKSAEGYCICGCAPASASEYSVPQLLVLGLIGGGPVLAGTMVGSAVAVNALVLVAAYGLAAGAVLSVVLQLLGTALTGSSRRWLASGILIGFGLAFATDLLLGLAGL